MTQELVDFDGYKAIKITYSYLNDRELIESVIEKATRMAGVVNPHSPDGKLRALDIRTSKLIGGLLAESAFLHYLNKRAQEKKVALSVIDSSFLQEEGLAKMGFNQIDLKIQVNGVERDIEIRSSFSYKTSLRRLFGADLRDGKGAFSLIGWYSSGNKPGEVRKDYYAFAIHYYDPVEIRDRIMSDVEVYLACVASKETIESEGVQTSLGQTGAEFTVINPLNSIEDPVSVIDKILEGE